MLIGSGVYPGKMLLVIRLLKIIKFMLILGQVRKSKDQLLSPAGLGKGLGQGPAGARNREKKTELIFNNPRFGVLTRSAPDHAFIKTDPAYKNIIY